MSSEFVVVAAKDAFGLPLPKALAGCFGAEVVQVEVGHFADGESLIGLSDASVVKGRTALVVAPFGFRETDSPLNDQLMQLIFLLHQVKLCGPTKMFLVAPYLPYSRQVKNVDDSRIGPLEALGGCFSSVGVDGLFSCELHDDLCKSVLKIPLHGFDLHSVWADVLREELDSEEEFCFLSPDRGGVERTKRVAELFGKESAYVEKKRVDYDKSVAVKLTGDVRGKSVVLIDDIIDTGLTTVHAAQLVMDNGAKRVLCCFAHAILSKGARELLKKDFIEKIWVTNSLFLDQDKFAAKITVVSIESYITEYVQGILS